MIKLIGRVGCDRCDHLKLILQEKNIEFDYVDLDNLDENGDIMMKIKDENVTKLPIIIKDGEIVEEEKIL